MLLIAAILTFAIGFAHSFLGEKYILIRLFRQPLPRLFGDDRFTRQTLRFVWHLLSIAWFGFAIMMLLLHFASVSRSTLLYVLAATFGVTAVIALLASRGKHLSWIVFSAISALCYFSVSAG